MTDFLIEYDGLSVALDKFLTGSRPRTRLRTPELSHSNAGTPITDGVSYEPLHLWDKIECLIDPTQRQVLDRIYARHLVDRLPMSLHDYSQVFTEHSATRTRPLATGSTATTDGGDIWYFAQFDVWPNNPPIYGLAGGYDKVSLSFTEFAKIEI